MHVGSCFIDKSDKIGECCPAVMWLLLFELKRKENHVKACRNVNISFSTLDAVLTVMYATGLPESSTPQRSGLDSEPR